MMNWFHRLRELKPCPLYLAHNDIPSTLATQGWLDKRGYQPMSSIKGYIQTADQKLPLYEKTTAKPLLKGADLSFNGRYFKSTDSLPFNLKPMDYFLKHQLPTPITPIAKQRRETDFLDLYPLPHTPFNSSQHQEAKEVFGSSLCQTLYCCSWDELPSDLKTKHQLSRYGLKTLPPMKAQNISNQKLYPLYSFKETLALQKALTQKPTEHTPIYKTIHGLPAQLVTFEWLDQRGFRPTPTVHGFLRCHPHEVRPLFLKEEAQPYCQTADLSFKGHYYHPFEYPKDTHKDEAYFKRHHLPLPPHPIAKQKHGQTLINLYRVPITPLNRSQRQELEIELETTLSEIVYLCEWRELPAHYKTRKFFQQHQLPLPTQPHAQLVMNRKVFNLYEVVA